MRKTQEFQLLHISVLRQYIDLEFRGIEPYLTFKYDLERLIDDFVFLCLFVGNDFIPHIPTIDIGTGFYVFFFLFFIFFFCLFFF